MNWLNNTLLFLIGAVIGSIGCGVTLAFCAWAFDHKPNHDAVIYFSNVTTARRG